MARWRLEEAVFDMAIGMDQNDQGAVGRERDEIDMLDRRLAFRGQDDAGAMGSLRQGRSNTVEGGRNIIGIQNKVVDALIDKIVVAKDRQALLVATHALDRVLWHNYYVVPHWYIGAWRLAYWNKFARPKTLPLYYNPITYPATVWWLDTAQAEALQDARQANRPLTLR